MSDSEETSSGSESEYRFDLFVIGGGSGGLAAAIQAKKFGVKVGLCDFVVPSPAGTSWGLGGTCVNVGCIPKKLMHQAALLGQCLEDAAYFGWDVPEETTSGGHNHSWTKMVKNIHNHILSLNWGYRVALQNAEVEYFNALASFVDAHRVSLTGKKGEQIAVVSSQYFLIATGGRPKYMENVPGAAPGEFCITSDDIFTLPRRPGKVVIVGASYIALETAGFLNGLGLDVTVIVRSQLLRGFDQEMAEKCGDVLTCHGVNLIRDSVPERVECVSQNPPCTYIVHGVNTITGEPFEEPCNTVILAVGRSPNVGHLGLDKLKMAVDASSGKIITNSREQTNVPNIYAVGDVCQDRPELTPVAIQSGVLLARRLFGNSDALTDYSKIPTAVFTPLEYGCVGLSEEQAGDIYGQDDLEIYHVTSQPLEFVLSQRDKALCYSKLICVKSENERVVGFHYLGPNAGEVTQGFAVAIKLNATKEDFDTTIGIHPTCAEQLTTLNVTKSSGEVWIKTSC